MFASCGQNSYQTIELGTRQGSNGPVQDCSTPTPICFVFKSSESKGGKPVKNKGKGGDDKTAKARAEKKKAKNNPTKSKKSYVFEKDPNKTDVENFIDSIENFEVFGSCNDETCYETLIFKSIDFSNLIPDIKKLNPFSWFSEAKSAVTEQENAIMNDLKNAENDAKSGNIVKSVNDLEAGAKKEIAVLEGEALDEALSSTVNVDKVYFVVVYPYIETLQARADCDKMTTSLAPEKLQNMIEDFYDQNSDVKAVAVNFKLLGATEAELDADIENNPTRSQNTCLTPYKNIFADYNCNPSSATYAALSPFTEIENLRLSSDILEDFDECYYDYDSFVTFFVLHDKPTIQAFCEHWQFWDYPIDDIRNYFGEQIGFYFAFSVHYTFWLVALVLLSLFVQCYVFITGQATGVIIAVYSTSIIVWASLLMNVWGIQQSKFALEWGMLDFESKLKIRPDYQSQGDDLKDAQDKDIADQYAQGIENPVIRRPWYSPITDVLIGGVKVEVNPIDRSDFNYLPISHANTKLVRGISFILSICLQALIVYTTVMVYALQTWMSKEEMLGVTVLGYRLSLSYFSSYITTALNVGQSWIFAFLHGYVGDALNDYENHRTQDDYDNANILKQAMFTFVNSYVSFFYLAFIAGNQIMVLFGAQPTMDCAGYSDCMVALSVNLNAVLIANLVANNTAFFTPFIFRILNAISSWWLGEDADGSNALDANHELKEYASQYHDFESNGTDCSYAGKLSDAYCGFFKQFGYLMLFLPAYPASAAICLLANWIELQGDMQDFCSTLRALPVGAADIGSWSDVFQALIYIAVPVNCAIVIFTMGALDDFISLLMISFGVSASLLVMMKLLVFVVLQYVVFIMIALINSLVPSVHWSLPVTSARTNAVISNLTLIDSVNNSKKRA